MATQFTAVRVVLGQSGKAYCFDHNGNLYAWRNVLAFDVDTYLGHRARAGMRLYRDYWEHEAHAPTSKVRDDVDADVAAGRELFKATTPNKVNRMSVYEVLVALDDMRKLTSPPSVGETKTISIDELVKADGMLLALQERLMDDYGTASRTMTFHAEG